MIGSSILVLVLVSTVLMVMIRPASAQHPHEEGVGCGRGMVQQLYLTRDGEAWICKYNEQLDLYYWDPVPPPEGEEVDENEIDGGPDEFHFTTARTEWIRGVLHTGADVYLRRPLTAPLYKNPGQIAVFSRLWKWDGSTWSVCADSGWSYNAISSESHTVTFNWGSGPCGSGTYGSHAYSAHVTPNYTWALCGPLWSGVLSVGGAAASGISANERGARPPNRLPPTLPVRPPSSPR